MSCFRSYPIPAIVLAATLLVGCTTVPTSANTPATVTTATSPPLPSETLTPESTRSASECAPLSGDLHQQLEDIEQQVIELRGLSPTSSPTLELLSRSDLGEQIRIELQNLYPENAARDELQSLLLLGLVDEAFDPEVFYHSFYSEQVAGYYDPDKESIFLRCDPVFGAFERFSYVHEFTNFLQDAHFPISGNLESGPGLCEEDFERCAPMVALREGDAVLLQSQWLRIFATSQDVKDLSTTASQFETPSFDQAPPFIQANLLFPYMEGLSFVLDIYLQDGWAGVDDIYSDPPVSTEQILHPERYPSDNPVLLMEPSLLNILGDGWRQIAGTSLGEFQIRSFLHTFLSEADATAAVEGWGGDIYHAYTQDEENQSVGILLTQWDTIADTHEFYYALRDYGNLRFGEPTRSESGSIQWISDDMFILARLVSNQALLIMAPDADTLIALDSALSLPWSQQP